MASNEEVLYAVREVQMYNLQLYKYLTTGLLENSLLPQVEVEFDEYKRFSMEFFTRMDDPNILLVKKQEAQINVFMADVKKNDKLRRGVTNIQRSLVAQCNLGQLIPMVDGNMILHDFPELCVFNTTFSVPLTVLCDLILHKYNIHNQSAIMDMMRLVEEERISRMMSNPVPIRHSQNRPILPSDRPATVNVHQGGHITLMEAETITSTPAGLITLTEAETITSTPEGLITLPEVETITSTPAELITLTEAETITSTPEGLITLPEAETITSTPAELITLPEVETITSTQAEPTKDTQLEPITDTQPEPITDSQTEAITDIQAAITVTNADITDTQTEPITDTKAELVITQIHDDTPFMSLDDVSVEATANIGVDDIKLSDSMDDFIKELVQPATLCTPLQSAQADEPTNDEDTCDQLLSFLKDIPELNPDHCSPPKNSTISTATPKSVTPSLALQKNTMYAVPRQKKEAKRDYKEYPEYTPRTDPVISWDELIVKYKKLANTNNQEQSTTQEMTSLLPEAAKHEAVSQIEEVKPAGRSQTFDVEESPSCSQSSVVPYEQDDLGNQDVPMEVTTEQCEKVSGSLSTKVMMPSPPSSKELQKPMTDTKSSNAMFGIVENKSKRRQHTPKHPTENVSERAELLAALERKKQKAQRILNEQYNKSWDGKIFARSNPQTLPTVEKATKPTVTSKYPHSTKVIEHIGVLNQQTAKIVSQPAKVVSQPANVVNQHSKVVSQPAKVVSQPSKVVSKPAKVVSQPANVVNQLSKVVSQPAKVVSQPVVSQSRKRPAPSSVDTVMSASSAKRRREYKHRIILRIFREDSDWNVEQIVDRF